MAIAGKEANAQQKPVAPYTLGLDKSDLPTPLSLYNARNADRTDSFELLKSINRQLEDPLGDEVLRMSFDRTWDILEEALDSARSIVGSATSELTTDQKLDEILTRVKALDARSATTFVPPGTWSIPLSYLTLE